MCPFLRLPILPSTAPPLPMMPLCIYRNCSRQWVSGNEFRNGIRIRFCDLLTCISMKTLLIDFRRFLLPLWCQLHTGNCLIDLVCSLCHERQCRHRPPMIVFCFFMRLTSPRGRGRYYNSNQQIINKRVMMYCGIYNGQRANGSKHNTFWFNRSQYWCDPCNS